MMRRDVLVAGISHLPKGREQKEIGRFYTTVAIRVIMNT